MPSITDLLTADDKELRRKARIDSLVGMVDETCIDVKEVSGSLALWSKRISSESWLPPAVIQYLTNIEGQCRKVQKKLHDIKRLLGAFKKSQDVQAMLAPIEIERDVNQAKRLVNFYRVTLEPFLYHRSDPTRRGHGFTVEVLILFISDLYKTLGLTGEPMPLFSHSMSVDVFHEAYRVPQTMEFGVERWSLCAHEVGHKILQGPLIALVEDTVKYITDIILEKAAGVKKEMQEKWKKRLDLNQLVEELCSDILATIIMGPAYYRAALDDLKNSFFSMLEDQGRVLTHPPRELRLQVMSFVLEELGYASDKKLWSEIVVDDQTLSQGFDIMMKLGGEFITDPFGGFFGELFNQRAALLAKIRRQFPFLEQVALNAEKFPEVESRVSSFLNPLESMDKIYSAPNELPRSLDIVRALFTVIAKYPGFEHVVRLRAIRMLELSHF